MSIALYDHPDSPNCRKVRLLLAALDLPHRYERIDLLGGQTRSEAFLAINPRGQIPVLVDGDFVLPESNAILFYLAERFAPTWAGRDLRERATVHRFMSWLAPLTQTIAVVGFQRVIGPQRGQPTDAAVVHSALERFQRESAVLEHWLQGREFIASAPSIADLALGAWFEVAARVSMLHELTATSRWLGRLKALPFWQRAAGYELLERTPASADGAAPNVASRSARPLVTTSEQEKRT